MIATLTPIDDVKLQLAIAGSGDDSLLTSLQLAAEETILRIAGRSFDGGTFTEYTDGGATMIIVKNYPVLPGWELRVDPGRFFTNDSIIPTEKVIVRDDRGIVSLANGARFISGSGSRGYPQSVRFTYSTEASAVPEGIKRAGIELIGHWYREAKTWLATNHLNIRTITDGTVITEYPWGQSGGFSIPKSVTDLVKPFRTPVV
jgi:hypothetical protein